MQFNNINTQERDLHNVDAQSFPEIKAGWNKLELVEVGEEREENSGNALGASFTFKVVEGDGNGLTFKKWYCVQAKNTNAKWRQTQFENHMIRIAQTVGVNVLNSVDQLFSKPFYAFLSIKERQVNSREVDRNGDFIKKTVTDVDFAQGKLTDIFLSCVEFANVEQNDAAMDLTAPF